MKGKIRDICLRSGFTIKEGETDLKPYVYQAAIEIYEAGWLKGAEKAGRDALRERIAAMCLQGLLACHETIGSTRTIAGCAVVYADTLIAELDKEPSE